MPRIKEVKCRRENAQYVAGQAMYHAIDAAVLER